MSTETTEQVELPAGEFMTMSEAAKEAGMSRQRLDILCRDGRGPARFRIGGRWFVPRAIFDTWHIAWRRGRVIPAAEARAGIADLAAAWGVLGGEGSSR